jgi:hypothetical protein
MGIRFQKKIKLFKGVSLNLSKSGIGLSVGKKGASVSIEPDGDIMGNVGIPGTGLSYRTKLNKKKKGN